MMCHWKFRRVLARAVALAVALVPLTVLCSSAARAQGGATPANLLLFPAYIEGGASTESAKLTRRLVTDALRRSFSRLGIGVIVYDKNLSSIRRAVVEGERMVKEEDALKGPEDDSRKAQKFAEIVGAQEFVMVSVDNYKYDAASRTASFNLSLSRYQTGVDAALATVANPQKGVAPGDVAPARQEGSAVARAADIAADQATASFFPNASAVQQAKPAPKKSAVAKYALPAFVIALGVLYFSTQ